MRVRTARDGDVTAIAQLSRELAGHVADPDPRPDVGELIELGFGDCRWFDCLVAEIDSEVVGFASYSKRFEAHTRSRKLWLGDLVVLELWAENSMARDFYEKAGAKLDAALEVHLIPTNSG